MSVYDDPNYDWRKHDPGVADDVQGMMLDADHQAQPTGAPDADEQERMRRQERAFLTGLSVALKETLTTHGISVDVICPDRSETPGWLVQTSDSDGRQFEASLTFAEGIGIGAERGDTMGREIVGLITERILGARRRYFERMM